MVAFRLPPFLPPPPAALNPILVVVRSDDQDTAVDRQRAYILDWNPMESSSHPQRLGQPSNSFSGYAHPMASPIASYPFAQPTAYSQPSPIDTEKAALHQHYQQSAPSQLYPTSGQPSQWRSQYPVSPKPLSGLSHFNSRSASSSSIAYTRPRGLRIANILKPWIPIILYAITSLGFVAAISFWKAEVFQGASLCDCMLSEILTVTRRPRRLLSLAEVG